MGGGFLDLDQGRDQRGPGLGAEAAGLALGLDDDRRQLGDFRLRVANSFVDRGEQGREAVLLLADLRRGLRNPLVGLDRGIADPADFGLDRHGGLGEPVGAALGLANRHSDAFADIGGEAVDMLAQRRSAVSQRSDRIVLGAGLGGEGIQFGPGTSQRSQEMVRAFVAIGGKLGEALIDQAQPAVDFCDHPLRGALLLGHAARQFVERRIRAADVRSERARGLDSGGANASRRLLDKRGHGRCLSVDPGSDFTQRSRGAVEQRVERAREIRFCFTDPGGRADSGGIDLRQACREAVGRFGDHPVGLAGAFREDCDLLAQMRGFGCRLAADGAQLFGDGSCRGFGAGEVVEKHRDVGSGGFGRLVQRLAVADEPFAARIELASYPAEPPRCLVAETHQPLGHRAQRLVAVTDSLREHLQQRLQRARFGAHGDDRTGEFFGFPAARAAEHQPGEAEQCQRSRGDRDPLRDRGRRQRLTDEHAAGRPRRESEPQGRREAERDAEHLASAGAALFALLLGPSFLVERRLRRLEGDVFDGQVERSHSVQR